MCGKEWMMWGYPIGQGRRGRPVLAPLARRKRHQPRPDKGWKQALESRKVAHRKAAAYVDGMTEMLSIGRSGSAGTTMPPVTRSDGAGRWREEWAYGDDS
jgi:hypothetical protein